MNRPLAKQIFIDWRKRSQSGWVECENYCQDEVNLDGTFTANELKALAWCLENKVNFYDLEQD